MNSTMRFLNWLLGLEAGKLRVGRLFQRVTAQALLRRICFAYLLPLALFFPQVHAVESSAGCASDLTPDVFSPTARLAAAPSGPVLQGVSATTRLKEASHHDSLVQAMQAAHYAVETVGADAASPQADACYAGNPAQSLRCWFRLEGLELQSARANAASWKLNLRLIGYGRETIEAAEVSEVTARQNRVELTRAGGAVVEWYENRANGLEQGFTVQRAQPGDGPLRLILQAEGDLRPKLALRSGASAEHRHLDFSGEEVRRSAETPLREQVSEVKFVSADGQAVLRYSGLKVNRCQFYLS